VCFNISKFIRTGEHDLAVEVYRWCDASWIEDQDMWRLSGIERDVYLSALPAFTIWNITHTATLTNLYTDGILSISTQIRNMGNAPSDAKIKAELIERTSSNAIYTEIKDCKANAGEVVEIRFATTIANPLKWSAEKPSLYDLLLRFKGGCEASGSAAGWFSFDSVEQWPDACQWSTCLLKGCLPSRT
jgi:beta-galactosidase